MLWLHGLQPLPGGAWQPQFLVGSAGIGGGTRMGFDGQTISPRFFPRLKPEIIDPLGNNFSFFTIFDYF